MVKDKLVIAMAWRKFLSLALGDSPGNKILNPPSMGEVCIFSGPTHHVHVLKIVSYSYVTESFPGLRDFCHCSLGLAGGMARFVRTFDAGLNKWWRESGSWSNESVNRYKIVIQLFNQFRNNKGCRNVSQCHLKQSFSGLHSTGRSQFTEL